LFSFPVQGIFRKIGPGFGLIRVNDKFEHLKVLKKSYWNRWSHFWRCGL